FVLFSLLCRIALFLFFFFFFSSRRRHTIFSRDWSSDVCSSDLPSRIRRGALSRPLRGGAPRRIRLGPRRESTFHPSQAGAAHSVFLPVDSRGRLFGGPAPARFNFLFGPVRMAPHRCVSRCEAIRGRPGSFCRCTPRAFRFHLGGDACSCHCG